MSLPKCHDVVAYTYKADLYCPVCAVNEVVDRHELDVPDARSYEGMLNALAPSVGIDRFEEESFDSDDFPKVVFRDQLEPDDYCGRCLGELE